MHNKCNNLKIVKGNSRANKIAQEQGYDSAEALKKEYVGGDGSRFNTYVDSKTGEIVLVKIEDSSIQVATGLFK